MLVGIISSVAFQNYLTHSEVTTRTFITDITTTTSITTNETTSSITTNGETVDQFISLWQALHIAFGGNYTSVPSNTTVSLALYKFWFIGNEASSDATNIAYSSASGLPLQPVVEPFPDGVIVNVTGVVQGISTTYTASQSCEMYMLLWSFQVPSSIPDGGAVSVSAVTGYVIHVAPGQIALNLLYCPASSFETTTTT